jgi:hypothetical protein
MQTGTAAIVLLPPFESIDGIFGQQCLSHIERRGYQLLTVVHDGEAALRVLDEGVATVVVFARSGHPCEDWTPRNEPGRYAGMAAPCDESPTVAILDRWRSAGGRRNGRVPEQSPSYPRGDDGGFAERFLRSRRNGRDT